MNHSPLSNQYLPLFRYSCRLLGKILLLTADINHEESLKNGRTHLQEELSAPPPKTPSLRACPPVDKLVPAHGLSILAKEMGHRAPRQGGVV
jgi:hypothetical protein